MAIRTAISVIMDVVGDGTKELRNEDGLCGWVFMVWIGGRREFKMSNRMLHCTITPYYSQQSVTQGFAYDDSATNRSTVHSLNICSLTTKFVIG